MIFLLFINTFIIGVIFGMTLIQRMTKKVFKAADDAITANNRLIDLLKLRIHLYEHKYGENVDEHVLH